MSSAVSHQDRDAEAHEFHEEFVAAAPSQEHLRLEDLEEVKLEISADLGRCKIRVRDVLELQRGSVLALDKLAGEMADIFINDVPFGRGEVVVLVDSLHVRVAEIIGAMDKDGGHG
jgi:flagellar motor switch protein FliN/FliY